MTEMKTKMISLCLAAVMAISGGTTVIAADSVNRQTDLQNNERPTFFSEMEDTQATSWGIAPEFADTENGQRPELPDGEAPDGERPELPDGETPDGERPELPDGEAPDGERPELPDGEAPDGQAPQQGANPGQDLPGHFREMLEQLIRMIYELYGGQTGTGDRMALPGGMIQQSAAPEGPIATGMTGPSVPERTQEVYQLNEQNSQPGMTQGGQQSGQQPDMGQGGQQSGQQPGMPGGNSGAPESYQATTTLTENSENQAYVSTGQSENAVLVDGTTVSMDYATVQKTGDSGDESADFYGTNAAVLADNGADLTISNANITTDGSHANGVFSYGTGTSVTISDSAITTTGNNSGGLMTTGGASLTASNLTVITSGNSSAAIRSDRGGGTVTVTEGSYSASGMGSPAVYSTADITVSNATLTASASEAVVIEGGNSVTLNNATASGNNSRLNGQSTVKTNVLIYQSMSGDASEGASEFTMNGGSMTAETGTMFHVTNVTTTINLSGVDFTYAADSDSFLSLSADAWGTVGKNGGNATVNLDAQTVQGAITVDSVSSLTLNAANGSSYTGAINTSGAAGTVDVTLESGSTWTLTGDSYITSLSGDTSGIDLNGYSLYVGGEKVSL